MPKAVARTEPGKVANDRESLSSATQLSNFGVRLAKFTHRVSTDGASDFSSNYVLPANVFVISVAADVKEAYAGGTATTATVAGVALTITATGVVGAAGVNPVAAGELTAAFDANDSTSGEATFAVAYIDLSEVK